MNTTENPPGLSHVDDRGRATMVDVGGKAATHRRARARAIVVLPEAVLECFGDDELTTKKGPVFQTAILAGVMAAKKTSELIPLCHPLPLENCQVAIALNDRGEAVIESQVDVHHKTGVEMEALTACSVAALTIYDMCKALSQDIVIGPVRLLEKTGGKHDIVRD